MTAKRSVDRLDLVRVGGVVDPGPATRDAVRREPVIAAVMALAAVVLPMPISPTASRSTPLLPERRRSRRARPRRRAAPRRETSRRRPSCHAVPGRTDARTNVTGRPDAGVAAGSAISLATPTSITHRSARHSRGKHVDRGTTGQEVRDHLAGHRRRVGRHAVARDAVVGGGHDDRPPREGGPRRAG